MRSEAEVLESINLLRSQLGMESQSEPVAPTAQSTEDVQARIDALNQKLATTPMSRREFIEKRVADDQMSFGQKSYQFGAGAIEGFSMLYNQGKDAIKEFYQGMTEKDFDGDSARVLGQTLGAIGEVGGKDFWQFGKTIFGSIGDELGGYTEEEEIEREYRRYLDNHNYHNVTREKMLEDVEYRKVADFGANFIDPFMAFPVAKLGSIGARGVTKGVQKAATGIAYSARNTGAVNVAKFAKGTAKVAGKVDKVVDVVGKIGAYPTELASRITGYGLRKGIKGASAVAGLGLKGVGKAGAGVEFVASVPRKVVEKGIKLVKPKGTEGLAVGGQVVGAFTGTIPGAFELGIAEGMGAIAKTLGSKAGAVFSVLGQPSANKRFLHRLATSDKVSEATRKRAMWAYTHYGTSIGDAMFNTLANSLTLGGINAGLAGLAGEDARATGSAFGSGAMAGMIPVGQEGMRAGKTDVQRDNRSIDQYMTEKLAIDQRKEFSKLPRHTQVLIATLQESGIGAPEVKMVESKPYLDMLNADRAKINEQRIQNNQQPLPLLDRAPSGHYEPSSGTIYMNADKLKDSSLVGIESMTHEIGHDYMHKALGQDPAMLELILERYKTTKDDPDGTAFYMMTDGEGNGIGEPIYLNQEATTFRQDYDRVQKGIKIGNDANLLAQEIGAEQFAMHFVEEPNVLKQIHPRLRRHALDASRKLLSKIGVVDASTGNPLFNPISKEMRKNPAIERIYKNYGAMRAFELDEKANLAKDGILIEPKQGQTGESRYTQLFGGIGLKLKDAKNLVVTNKGLLRELINLRNRWKDDPSDGWSVKNGQLVGNKLTSDLRTIFTRNDPFGNVANILDALQQAIDERIGIRFGYRSGTKGKYQNPFRLRDVAIYGWQVGSLGGKGRATLKVLGYDQAVVRQNVQVLVEKGYIKDPNQFMTELAEQGQKALQDPEGRINPEGRGENELMTVAFGLKESADQVRSEGLRDLLESKAVNKSFRSYDVEALAGLTKGESKAFAFDYYNVRNNYNPFRGSSDKLYQPLETFEGSKISPLRKRTNNQTRALKNPVYLRDGARISGFVDNEAQDPFYGYDKNGQEFTIRREFLNPDDIVRSKDNDKTANLIKDELTQGGLKYMGNDRLFMPSSEDQLPKARDTRYVNEGEVQREKRESVHSKGGVGTTRPKKVSYANRSELDLLRRLDRATSTDIGKAFSKKDKISSIFPKKVEAPYNKPVSLVGKIINDQADLAPLLTAFRHPYQEFLGCCIVDKAGKIKSANIIASGTIVASMVPYQVILREAFKVPDSKIFIWHNHPGGNPKPSAGDLGVTQTLVSNLKDVKNTKFGGHVVTNGDKYGFINVAGDITINKLPKKDLAIWERVSRNELFTFEDFDVGAQIAANLRQSDPKEYVHGIFVNRRNRVVGIQRVPFKMKNQHLSDLAEGALESGATAVVIADYDDSANTNALLNKHSMLKGFFAERGLELMDLFEPKVGSFEKTGNTTMPERVMFRPAGDTPTLPQQFQPRQNSMMPATARAVATSASTLDRFRN